MTTELYSPEQLERERGDAAIDTAEFPPVRRVVNRAYARATGAPLIPGNGVRLLVDAEQNYPAWLEAIKSARRTIHFESFIIHEDDVGREFAAALCEKARGGVRVRVVYDWLGSIGKTSRRFWRNLRDAGVEVRCFNPPRLDAPFARVWETACGEKIPDEHLPARESIGGGGDVAVRVIATEPNTVGLYRLEKL